MKITKLTVEQQARFPEFVDRWLKIGLSTERADRGATEEAAKFVYKEAGLTRPDLVVWCDSPLSLCIADAMIRNRDSIRESVWASVEASVRASVGESIRESVLASVWESVWASVEVSVRASVGESIRESVLASVWASVRESVRASVWASVEASVRASVGESVEESVWESVWESVEASVEASVGESALASVEASVRASVGESVEASVLASVEASVRASVGESVWESVYGQHEAGWLSFYSYFLEVCELAACKRLSPIMTIAQSSGWWIPRKGVVLFSERPIRCEVNDRKVLHSDGRMAIEYPDGFGVYANDGLRLPQYIGKVPVKDWEPEWCLTEKNAEIKRKLLEKIPREKVQAVLGLKVIDTYQSPKSLYELVEAKNNPFPSRYRALRFTCPTTGKPYIERVHPDCKSAQEAVIKSNHGIAPEEFGWEM